MMKFFSLALLVACMSFSAFAKAPAACDSARKVAEKYIALDRSGETTHTSSKIDKLVEIGGRDMPAWDSVTLTKDSRITDCKATGATHAEVEITHSIFGNIDGSVTLDAINAMIVKIPHKEVTTLGVDKTAKGWKIDSSTVYSPHISLDAANGLAESGKKK